jgi:nucleotide-binding universal stress UspA family protein
MSTILACVTPRVDEPWVAETAAQLAGEMQGQVVILSVEDVESQRFEQLPRSQTQASATEAAERAAEQLRAAGAEPADVLVRSGRPVQTVLDVADEVDAAMILVGSSPRRPLAQKLLGSVALELVRRSRRNVMVISEPA